MKSKKLLSTVLSISLITGGLLCNQSPVYKLLNSNKNNIVYASENLKYENLREHYDVKEIGSNPAIEDMLDISKAASHQMINIKDSSNYSIWLEAIPHNNKFYYCQLYNEKTDINKVSFVKNLGFRLVDDKVIMDYALLEYENSKLIKNEINHKELSSCEQLKADLLAIKNGENKEEKTPKSSDPKDNNSSKSNPTIVDNNGQKSGKGYKDSDNKSNENKNNSKDVAKIEESTDAESINPKTNDVGVLANSILAISGLTGIAGIKLMEKKNK